MMYFYAFTLLIPGLVVLFTVLYMIDTDTANGEEITPDFWAMLFFIIAIDIIPGFYFLLLALN